MAHMFEHMAFKGSETIGTKNYKEEAIALTELEEAYLALKNEQQKGDRANKEKLKLLKKAFEDAREKTEEYLQLEEFEEALIRSGSRGLNAFTSWDATRYVVSLPSNKIELWMSLESERFLRPVLREFYKERDVVMEERRMRTDSNPIGRLVEEFMAVAYKAHPYGEPPIGHMSDLQTITRTEAEEFFETYYTPNNLTVGIVGDVNPKEVKKMAEVYFGRIPNKPLPPKVETVEPPQKGERRIVVEDPSQPFVLIGYHKPGIQHKDNAVFDAITDIMGVGRTSRLYTSLVKEKKIAVAASGFQGLPGQKYPGLFLYFAVPSKGHTNEECELAINEEIEKLKTELVTDAELQKAKTRARAGLIRELDSNSGLAGELTQYEVLTGDWRNLFQQLDQIEKVTAEDIKRVANEYFNSKNRTVGIIKTTDVSS
jgi:predicted Zn-dependent peptidase